MYYSDSSTAVTSILTGCLLFVFAICLWALLAALPIMWLWNWLMPCIFKLPEITFWQALGISLLSNILFKGTVNTTTKK